MNQIMKKRYDKNSDQNKNSDQRIIRCDKNGNNPRVRVIDRSTPWVHYTLCIDVPVNVPRYNQNQLVSTPIC